ncbi:MAG: hypothetical protein JNN33_17665 [Rhodospirillaceae bacterium]|jgi:hypothetical protein|nr:hypothetical protein [Rhodospirillaceae bacterium]
MNKSSRMADLLAITSRLIACMEREIELLRTLQPKELRRLQEDKTALADAYRAFVLALKEPDEAADSVNDVLRDELAEATERFQATLADNLRALRAMRDVNERVMRAVVQALEEPRIQVTGYNQRGALKRGRRSPLTAAAAVQQRA